MNIGVLGTEMVAKTIAGKLAALGHSVMLGTRDVKAAMARGENDKMGGPPLRTWRETHPAVALGTLAEAAAHGALVVNALAGHAALDALSAIGDSLAAKILVDLSNPLDFSKGMPPSLLVSNTDSLGEQIQRALPRTRVVKTLNTVNALLMVDPRQLAGGDHTNFVAGDDAGAKAEVTRLLQEGFGWRDVVDLGDITTARGLEMYLPLWVRLWGALKTPMFNLKVVR
jgi:predicted dinucleotide-binding enzyme